MRTILSLFIFFLFSSTAFAGGSYEPVLVTGLEITGDDFKLVLSPQQDESREYKDPFMGQCKSFSVQGSHSRLWWLFKHGPSKDSHRQALKKLEEAKESKSIINFGWMGSGFKILDPKMPCIVESKGLALRKLEKGDAVMSYYNSI